MALLIWPVSFFLLVLKTSEPFFHLYYTTGPSHNLVLSGVGKFSAVDGLSSLCSLHPPFMPGDPLGQERQASLSDMTHLALCSLPAEVFFLSQRAHEPGLPLAVEREAQRREKHFFTNRKCFESAVGFLTAQRINSEEPARLSHMIQHPLINATRCCVTKSQLHHAPPD